MTREFRELLKVADKADTRDEVDARLKEEILWSFIRETLTQREAKVLELYYRKGLKFVEIAKHVTLSHTRIGQISAKAHRKLRHPSRFLILRSIFEDLPIEDTKESLKKIQKLREEKEEREAQVRRGIEQQERLIKEKELIRRRNEYLALLEENRKLPPPKNQEDLRVQANAMHIKQREDAYKRRMDEAKERKKVENERNERERRWKECAHLGLRAQAEVWFDLIRNYTTQPDLNSLLRNPPPNVQLDPSIDGHPALHSTFGPFYDVPPLVYDFWLSVRMMERRENYEKKTATVLLPSGNSC